MLRFITGALKATEIYKILYGIMTKSPIVLLFTNQYIVIIFWGHSPPRRILFWVIPCIGVFLASVPLSWSHHRLVLLRSPWAPPCQAEPTCTYRGKFHMNIVFLKNSCYNIFFYVLLLFMKKAHRDFQLSQNSNSH